MDGWETTFILEPLGLFSGAFAVSLREGILYIHLHKGVDIFEKKGASYFSVSQSCLEDHPVTCKWLITMVHASSPKT